jgi:hypothetical protein
VNIFTSHSMNRRILFILAAILIASQTHAQPASPVKMYGVGDDEFLVSGYLATSSPDSVGDLWNFARSLGVTAIQPKLTPEEIDTLMTSNFRDPRNGRLIVRGLSPVQDAGAGRELQFYPFDSAQSPFYIWKFTRLAGGRNAFNLAERGARERIYASDSTRPGQMVAGGVAYDWHPWQIHRFAGRGYDTTAQDASALIDYYLYRQGTNRRDPTFYIATRAHLLPGGTARGAEPLLRIELWYEIPRGRRYRDASGAMRTAADDVELLYKTLLIPKDSLAPRDGAHWDAYRELSLPVNLLRGDGGVAGPLDPENESHRLDLRLYWLGGEPVAVRSVAVRDSIGELLLGSEPASVAYRDAIISAARRVLYGPARVGALRRGVIRIMAGIEPHPTEFAATAAVDSLLRRATARDLPSGPSLAVHNEGGTSEFGLRSFVYMTHPDAIYTEIGLSAPVDTAPRYADDLYKAYHDRFRIPLVQVPALASHNGGRFQIPLLEPTADAIENRYEPVLQIHRFGQFSPTGIAWPWSLGGVSNLGHGALASRASGARMIATVFTTGELHVRLKDAADRVDTLMSHPPEAAELRAMVNLSLAYGAHGIHYYWLGNYTNFAYQSPVDQSKWLGSNDSWGSNGPLTSDTVLDHADTFRLTDNRPTPQYPRGTPRIFIPNFFVGYGTRTRELKRIDAWLALVGPELAKLRWRDSYSMHMAVPGPHIDERQVRPRPLSAGEIVRSITAASRRGVVDPPHATYVELGLFEPVAPGASGARDSLRDTAHIFVVNRRAFERPDDIDAASPLGRTLDSLAESRKLTIRFNLARAGDWRDNIIHVRELAADGTPLPLASTPRMPLDTFIVADSAVELWLRPGGGALLEITYPLAMAQDLNDEIERMEERDEIGTMEERDETGTMHVFPSEARELNDVTR